MSKIFEPTDAAVGIKVFKRPVRDPADPLAPVVWWNRQTAGIAYEPYVVRVHQLAAHTASGPWILKFFFLDNDTGTDLAGLPYEVDLNNSNHAHCLAPSSIQLYDAANPASNCGFLFLTRDYINSPAVQSNATNAGVVLPTEAVGDEKWPRSAGMTVVELARRLTALLGAIPKVDDVERSALFALFTVLRQLPLAEHEGAPPKPPPETSRLRGSGATPARKSARKREKK